VFLLIPGCADLHQHDFDKSNVVTESDNMPLHNDLCDAIYVITLDRTPERFNKLKKRFHEAGIDNVTRFHAVDGFGVVLVNKATGNVTSGKPAMLKIRKYLFAEKPAMYHVSYGGKYKDAEFDLSSKFRRLSAGEIGVTFSHRAVWLDVVENNYKRVIVFEDDVIPMPGFKKKLQQLLQNIPNDADITFLIVGRRKEKRASYPKIENIFRDFDNVPNNEFVAKIQPNNLVYGMYGYVIDPIGAKKLLNMSKTVKYAIDDIVYQRGGVNAGKLKAYVAKQKLCSVSMADSEIKKMGRSF
jgi:GR25 family glycosyltransferase involved in LPS biosynthesis